MRERFLHVQGLNKNYIINHDETCKVLKDITFAAKQGEILILMGPSGAGKSTLFNLLLGIEEPTGGLVWINSQNINELNDNERTRFRKHNIGIVFQFFELHQGLTCQETLELKLLIANPELTQREIQKKTISLLEEVGLKEKADVLIDELSRGEKQRVAIARALVNDPKLILADEPTGALDMETATEIVNLLRQAIQQRNCLLIISTHDFNIPQDGDRVILLEDGRIKKDLLDISKNSFLQLIETWNR